MTKQIKTMSQNEQEGPSQDDGFPPSCASDWIGDCRQALRNITCGAKTERAMLVARESMKYAGRGGENKVDMYKLMAARSPLALKLPAETLAQIDLQIAKSDDIREFIAVWVARDKRNGPCSAEDSACAKVSRLRYLVRLGIIPAPTPEQEAGIKDVVARKREAAKLRDALKGKT